MISAVLLKAAIHIRFQMMLGNLYAACKIQPMHIYIYMLQNLILILYLYMTHLHYFLYVDVRQKRGYKVQLFPTGSFFITRYLIGLKR